MTRAVILAHGSKAKGGNVIELPYLDGVQHAAFPDAARVEPGGAG